MRLASFPSDWIEISQKIEVIRRHAARQTHTKNVVAKAFLL